MKLGKKVIITIDTTNITEAPFALLSSGDKISRKLSATKSRAIKWCPFSMCAAL